MLNPLSLAHAMENAVKVEEKCRVLGGKENNLGSFKMGIMSSSVSKGGYSNSYSAVGMPIIPSSVTKSWTTGTTESHASVYFSKPCTYTGVPQKPMGEIKRLIKKEFQEKKAKGLYFRCDDKWSMGHRCKRKELSVLLLEKKKKAMEKVQHRSSILAR